MPSDVQVPEGLVYVDDRMPGISRKRAGKGFCFVGPDGATLKGPDRSRCLKLAVPPAYESVWICALENGHLQATGLDARGRKQYRYHPDWGAWRSAAKYDTLPAFGAGLGRLRRRVDRDLKEDAGDLSFSLAAMVLLIDRTYLRAGTPAYTLANKTFGATTLLTRHLSLADGVVRLKFKAKGGKAVNRTLRDKRLHRIMHQIGDLPGRHLFTWVDEEGEVRPVSSHNLNDYIAEGSGVAGATAKTFRTWGGSLAAFTAAREPGKLSLKSMCELAAEALGNTPTIARKSYIHPEVLALSDMEPVARIDMLNALPTEGDSALKADERRMLAFLNA
ncbi:DNA topoisomerase IB [Falsirhodobacter halotolerans]|uniref:DNA topoisomerase IB n=1 Tax=Falsirhodobacter halotolerans TaxID=1146892 RepID=UPI001FD3B3BE|nr:DNA topoisomerase IB [Falsirhodobacter halotolerans]MCJ8138829.1 DNA topoisomerase IB [Falsirhodobacter halotolerans]